MPVNTFLEPLRAATNEMRRTAAAWALLPAEALLQQPAPGSWSVAQCLDHLNGYGDFYLPRLEAALREVPAGTAIPEFRTGWLGNYFARSMEPGADGRPKSKMKAFAKHVPLPDLDAGAVLRRFIEQQDTLLRLLDTAAGRNLNARVIPLSIAGWLRLKTGDVCRFLVAHNRRHLAQAGRALSAAGLPHPGAVNAA